MPAATSRPIPLVYAPAQAGHAPKTETAQSSIQPYRETPDRAQRIYDHLVGTRLARQVIPQRPLEISEMTLVHTPDFLAHLAERSESLLDDGTYLYPEMFPSRRFMEGIQRSQAFQAGWYATDPFAPIGRHTWEAVAWSAASAWEGAELLLSGQERLVYALCRPPGHHAGSDFCGGYCYVNNAALAAARLERLGCVAILDVDYHHGNGTQEIFWNHPGMLYVSIHGDPVFEYPFVAGYADEGGGAAAHGTTLNFPLPKGTTGAQYLAAYERAMEVIRTFQPAALVISLGFDAHRLDPLSTFLVDTEDFYEMARQAHALGLPTLLVQEGGYNLEMLPELAETVVHGFGIEA